MERRKKNSVRENRGKRGRGKEKKRRRKDGAAREGFEARFTEHRLFFPDRWTVQSFRDLFANPGYCRSTFCPLLSTSISFSGEGANIRDSLILFENLNDRKKEREGQIPDKFNS